MSINDCKLFELPKISDERGRMGVVESTRHLPFEIKRLFYLYSVAPQQTRGAHAHNQLHQFLISIAGEFQVELDDGKQKKTILLNNPHAGLHVPPLHWCTVKNFSSDAVCLVLASDFYDESDYYL